MNLANLQQTDEHGNPVYDEDGNPVMTDLRNAVIDGSVLITAPLSNNSESGDGYYDADGIPGIGFESTMTDDQVRQIANEVNEGTLTPGGVAFAERFSGATIQLAAAQGILTGTVMYPQTPTATLHVWHFEGGAWREEQGNQNGGSITVVVNNGARTRGITENSDGTIDFEIDFDVDEPTYCYLYFVENENEGASARPVKPIGKRERAHGKIVSVGVKVSKVKQSNPPSQASGGTLPESEDPKLNIDDSDGIRSITINERAGNNRWYNLQGQQIDEPTKKGLYIKNGKVIAIKNNR